MSDKLVKIAEESTRGGIFLLTGHTSQLIILTIGSIIVARLLGPENYGLLSLSLVIPSIFTGFLDLGINPALVRFSAKHRAEGKPQLAASMLKAGFTLKLALSATMFLICFFLSDSLAAIILKRPEIGFFIKLASSAILFQIIYGTLDSAFMGLDRMEGNALIMNIQAVAKAFLSPLLVVLGFGVAGAVVGHVSGYALAGLAGGLILLKIYRGLGKPSGNGFLSNLRVMIGYGFPLYLSSLLVYFLGQYQPLVLAFFVSNMEIGNFSVATMISTAAISVLTYPLAVLFPAFSKLNPDGEEVKRLFKLSIKYTALLIVPASIALAILSENLVYLIYGRSYSLAPLFLSLYSLTFLYSGFGSFVLDHLFNGVGETRIVFNSNLIKLFAFLPLSYMLVMLYNVLGLIIALLISSVFPLSYGLFIARKKLQVSFDARASLKIYLASSLSALPTLMFIHFSPYGNLINVLSGGLIFLLAYLTLLPIVRGISSSDLDNFNLIFRKNKALWPLLKLPIAYESKLLRLAS